MFSGKQNEILLDELNELTMKSLAWRIPSGLSQMCHKVILRLLRTLIVAWIMKALNSCITLIYSGTH